MIIIYQDKIDRWSAKRIEARKLSADCVINQDHFLFPKGYYFKHGYMKKRKALFFNVISEIRTNTYPPTAIVNENEVIFLRGLAKENLQNLKGIRLTEPADNWELICEDFLDTEYEQSEKDETTATLARARISNGELESIRKRLRFRMLLKTYFSWEWIYYGQLDVLRELWPVTEKKYWWTMDVALRGNKTS